MSVPTPRLALPRSRRMNQGRDFARAKASGRRLAGGCLVANWLTLPSPATSRVGIITGRRLGGAVVRTRARRLLREAFRQHQYDLAKPVDLVLVARPSIVGKTFTEVERDFLTLLQRAGLLKASP